MKLDKEQIKVMKWFARIIALVAVLFGLPFYFGYGNPLPFANPDYSIWDNILLAMYPLIFIGLALGWKYEKIGGYLIVVPIILGFILGLATEADFMINMLFPIIPGMLYLMVGHATPTGFESR
ncbi:MAG: hypothetical protein PHW73_05340 [Atribacterota bacterium]|nr:hypothetical protein [Atribacterota bacterium]